MTLEEAEKIQRDLEADGYVMNYWIVSPDEMVLDGHYTEQQLEAALILLREWKRCAAASQLSEMDTGER